jgi:hypothetical protein
MASAREYFLSDEENSARDARVRNIDRLVTDMRLRGLEPVPDYFPLAQRFIEGSICPEEFSAALARLDARRSGISLALALGLRASFMAASRSLLRMIML